VIDRRNREGEKLHARKETSLVGTGRRLPVKQRLLRVLGSLVRTSATAVLSATSALRMCASAAVCPGMCVVFIAAAWHGRSGPERAGTDWMALPLIPISFSLSAASKLAG
jgi:hypothetical protein